MRKKIAGLIIVISGMIFGFEDSRDLRGQSLSSTKSDTIFISYSDDLRFKIPQKHSYHQTLTMKLFMSQALFDGKLKRKDNGKSEFARKRIDSICNLLPLSDAGTVHIDAFHSWPPVPVPDGRGGYRIDLTPGPISPFLGYSVEDETEAQRRIFRYWASKEIDVTSEGVDFLRETAFEGYEPMAWWFGGGLRYYLKWPASFYCGGQENSEWGKLFGTSMHGEDIVRKDRDQLPGFKEDFCLKTVIWYYLNRLDRQYVIDTKNYKEVGFSSGVKTSLSEGQYKITLGNRLIAENNDIFIPAPWINSSSIIAYSKEGYKSRDWSLPDEWSEVSSVKLSLITDKGKVKIGVAKIKSGAITLALQKDEMVLIEKM